MATVRMTKRLRELRARFIVDVPSTAPTWRPVVVPARDVVDIRNELRHLEDGDSREARGARLALQWVLGLATAPCNVFARAADTEKSA